MDTAVSMVSREKENEVIEIAERLANERIVDILYPDGHKEDAELIKRDERSS